MSDSSTNKTIKAVRATIYLGNIPLEVFQLPSGEYRLSQTGVSVAIGDEETQFRNFLTGKSPEALPYKGFKSAKISVEGLKVKINAIPIEIASAYWLKEAITGNKLAAAIIGASLAETIERRADAAFNVQRTEEERQARYQVRLDGKVTRRELTDAIADYIIRHPELSDNARKWMYPNVSDAVNLAVFGRKAARLADDLQVAREHLRNAYTRKELLLVQQVEDTAMRIVDAVDSHPHQAVKDAGSRLLISIQTRIASN